MTVKELSALDGIETVTLPSPDREIEGVYIGDLLSWVMGRAKDGDAWITIMSNINIIAVASLADTACIILAENVELESDVITTAQSKGINILRTSESIYEIAVKISGVI